MNEAVDVFWLLFKLFRDLLGLLLAVVLNIGDSFMQVPLILGGLFRPHLRRYLLSVCFWSRGAMAGMLYRFPRISGCPRCRFGFGYFQIRTDDIISGWRIAAAAASCLWFVFAVFGLYIATIIFSYVAARHSSWIAIATASITSGISHVQACVAM